MCLAIPESRLGLLCVSISLCVASVAQYACGRFDQSVRCTLSAALLRGPLPCVVSQCVERVTRCSAKAAVEEVHAVFNQATHMVMFPVTPLYDDHTDVRAAWDV